MPNVSTDLYLEASKRKADGTCPVYVRVTANRKSRLVSTGVYVEPRHWDKNRRRVRASHGLADAYNARLQAVLAGARQAALDDPGGPFTAYVERHVERLRGQGDRSFWEARKFSATLDKVRGALGAEVDRVELDRDALAAFERHCRETKGNGANTTREELVRPRRVVKEAIWKGAIGPADDPFLIYDVPRRERVERRKLPLSERRSSRRRGPASSA